MRTPTLDLPRVGRARGGEHQDVYPNVHSHLHPHQLGDVHGDRHDHRDSHVNLDRYDHRDLDPNLLADSILDRLVNRNRDIGRRTVPDANRYANPLQRVGCNPEISMAGRRVTQ